MTEKTDILVAGSGASGMIAAITAARNGARVLVIERMRRVGKKLLATGNGRCNLSNTNCSIDKYHGNDPGFAFGAIDAFGVDPTLDFFDELGIVACIEDDGKVFPASYQASSVLDVLRYEMDKLGIEVICDKRVQKILSTNSGLRCVCTDETTYSCKKVIIAQGGKSSPNLGSNGGGYKIAKDLGHKIIDLYPALVQVKLDAPFLKRLKGLKFEGRVEVRVDGEPQRSEKGEILCTDYGISGPPVLQISRIVGEAVERNKEVTIHIDILPELSIELVSSLVKRRIENDPQKPTDFSFIGLLHKRLIPVILQEAGLKEHQDPCGKLTRKDVENIVSKMKDWPLKCIGTRSWMDSQVTAGGIDTSAVDRNTLESRLAPGVYFCGEVLDIDGDCGGYNLQWAWSSGYVAGLNASEALK